MDETPIWMDMPGTYTLDVTGTKTISMTTTGHEKSRLTVCLSAMADGTKLTPLVLLKGLRPPKDVPPGVIVKMTPKSWANEEGMEFWLKNVWSRNSQTRRLSVWDSFSAHRTSSIKKSVSKTCDSDFAIIRGGCTSKLQPCDVSWNKPFKDAYRNLYDDWLFDGKVELTKGNNRKPPEKITILRWIRQAWQSVTPDTIRKSFQKCGITNALDGSEDHLLFADSDSDDPFDGFDEETPGERDARGQLVENVNLQLDAVNEWSDEEQDDEDDNDGNDYSSPDSPSH